MSGRMHLDTPTTDQWIPAGDRCMSMLVMNLSEVAMTAGLRPGARYPPEGFAVCNGLMAKAVCSTAELSKLLLLLYVFHHLSQSCLDAC